MESVKLNTEPVKWLDEHTIDLIRKIRNDLIKDFLDDRHLISYIETQFNLRELSRVKIELIRKDLKELLISPVDTKHYTSLIEHVRQNNSASLTDKHEALFYEEIGKVLKEYIY